MTAPILYIEDEEDYQILVERILGRAGLHVRHAATGAEGMTLLRQERPSMLLLDINLPDTDGYALCEELREDPLWADLPVLMVTVRRRPEEWLRGFSAGATDYISKPLNPPELVERVTGCLEGKTPINNKGSPEYHLVRAAVAGNRAAFQVLIQKYRERLTESLRHAMRHNVPVEDMVSDAFAIAFEKLNDFRGEASFYTWVYRIALNEVIGSHRRPGTRISLDELADGEESHLLTHMRAEEPLEKTLTDRETNRLAMEALGQVPDPYREVLEMFFLEDLSYHAIAKKLRIPEGTVMSRLHKARKLLQEIGALGYNMLDEKADQPNGVRRRRLSPMALQRPGPQRP